LEAADWQSPAISLLGIGGAGGGGGTVLVGIVSGCMLDAAKRFGGAWLLSPQATVAATSSVVTVKDIMPLLLRKKESPSAIRLGAICGTNTLIFIVHTPFHNSYDSVLTMFGKTEFIPHTITNATG
jgi:hypothetical protein